MKLLPYPDTPMFQCYHNMAFPFGVIQANSPEDMTKWMCTKCTNCIYFPNSNATKFNIAVQDGWGVDEHLVNRQILQIRKDCLSRFNMDLLYILQQAIENNCYIYGTYNEKYIPGKWAYNQADNIHDFLIIGCDDNKFISVGYVAGGRFKRFEIPNSNLINGLLGTTDSKIDLNLYSYEQGAVPQPKINTIVYDLNQYMLTATYRENPTQNSYLFGIATHMVLKDFFVDEINKGKIYIDNRYSRVLYEHKWVFTQLVDSFLDEGEEKKKYRECAERNLERAKLVHMLGLKMRYTGKTDIINRVTDLIDQIIEEEMEYIPLLIKSLEAKYLG